MTDPIGVDAAAYLVVVNAEGQHALWQSFIPVPHGWTSVLGETDRQACLDYVEANWRDIRPRSLIESIARERQ